MKHIVNEYYVKMLSPNSLEFSKPYNDEEKKYINNLIGKDEYLNHDLVVIGAGSLWYAETALKHNHKYIALEPLLDEYLSEDIQYICSLNKRIALHECKFENVSSLNLNANTQKVLLFMFNIISYINDPIKHINEIINPGDIIIISTRAISKEAKEVRRKYIEYLNEGNIGIDPCSRKFICDLDTFDPSILNHFSSMKRTTNTHTDILLIQC